MEPRYVKNMDLYLFPETIWLLLVLLLFPALFLVMRWRQRPKNIPPGPVGLPLVGFMPFFSQREPHRHLDELRKTYGNVFGMYMGSEYYLILGDVHAVKEAFNMSEFTVRPEGCFQIGDDCANFASTSGQHWVDHRRLAVKVLRRQMQNWEDTESRIMVTVDRALERLEREKSEDGQVTIRAAITDAINLASFSFLCYHKDPLSEDVLDILRNFQVAFKQHAASLTVERFLPMLKPLMFKIIPSRKRIARAHQAMEHYCWSQIEAREKVEIDQAKDYLDYYLLERKKTNMAERLLRQDLNGDIQVMMFASGDTVRATTEWFLLLMAEHQDIQGKVHDEIIEVLGSSSEPSYHQREHLPYTEAVVLESMRHKTLVSLNPMHGTAKGKPTRFRDYEVPGGAVVLANLWSIHHDPNNWSHPSDFYPEHFLLPDENRVHIPEVFVPFGIGKRICIGDKLAMACVFIFAVRFLQRFKILPPKDGLNMEPFHAVTSEPACPIVRLLPRD